MIFFTISYIASYILHKIMPISYVASYGRTSIYNNNIVIVLELKI